MAKYGTVNCRYFCQLASLLIDECEIVDMRFKIRFLWVFMVFAGFGSTSVHAQPYAGLNLSLLHIDTDNGKTTPATAGIILGYGIDRHKFEAIFNTGASDDNLNILVTDIPASRSLLYRFTANPRDSLQIELILGYSQVEIEYKFNQSPAVSETFSGVSWGFGIEEALESIPQLRLRADFIQLYRGDDLAINSFNLGVNYAF